MREQSADLGQIVAKLRGQDIVLALERHRHHEHLFGVCELPGGAKCGSQEAG
jgi:hypothetical protein